MPFLKVLHPCFVVFMLIKKSVSGLGTINRKNESSSSSTTQHKKKTQHNGRNCFVKTQQRPLMKTTLSGILPFLWRLCVCVHPCVERGWLALLAKLATAAKLEEVVFPLPPRIAQKPKNCYKKLAIETLKLWTRAFYSIL